MLDSILENFPDEEILIADGFDDAIIGVDSMLEPRIIYSVVKCLDILVEEGMHIEEAMEHFTFNVTGSYVGEKTPIWCWDNY